LSRSPCRPPLSHQASGSGIDKAKISQDSFLSEDFSDHENEENDPIVHSFGPFGSNILSRLNSFSTSGERKSPTGPTRHRRRSLKSAPLSPQHVSTTSTNGAKLKRRESPIKNHVINQLAFSRVHAVPLSTIHGNLPAELKAASTVSNSTPEKDQNGEVPLTDEELKHILESIPCVGEIAREGKDAAGKVLENEYYYVPEMDDNAMRRDAVMSGMGGTGLRAVRKNHKVCVSYYPLSNLCLPSSSSNTTGSVLATKLSGQDVGHSRCIDPRFLPIPKRLAQLARVALFSHNHHSLDQSFTAYRCQYLAWRQELILRHYV